MKMEKYKYGQWVREVRNGSSLRGQVMAVVEYGDDEPDLRGTWYVIYYLIPARNQYSRPEWRRGTARHEWLVPLPARLIPARLP
ncbi:MAG TPA: hypothetical protein P5032_08920 [Candidatus Competibacter sp.]|nr:hypothetical protein [Candidatus Competibacter sp.]